MGSLHRFHAVAFADNVALKELAPLFPGARRSPHELTFALDQEGEVFIFPFGVVVFRDVPSARRAHELARLGAAHQALRKPVVEEELAAREDPQARPGLSDGVLAIDRVSPGRAGIIALTVAQSAAMEYYEGIVEQMFGRTGALVDRLERAGTVSLHTRPLHQFIGQAISTRSEVLSVLHLLDKPDATWEDPAMDRIYAELRAEFDLVDRYTALEQKLRSVQEALELILDTARDRRLVLLEASIVFLIMVEIVFSFVR